MKSATQIRERIRAIEKESIALQRKRITKNFTEEYQREQILGLVGEDKALWWVLSELDKDYAQTVSIIDAIGTMAKLLKNVDFEHPDVKAATQDLYENTGILDVVSQGMQPTLDKMRNQKALKNIL